MDGFEDLYALLGVASNAPHEVIRAAYRVMAKLHHPDANKQTADSAFKMARINHAYEVLSCPERRREYDQQVEQTRRHSGVKRVFDDQNTRFKYSDAVLTTYDHRGRLHAHT
jgi:curved DNA-binding protein CbpA